MESNGWSGNVDHFRRDLLPFGTYHAISGAVGVKSRPSRMQIMTVLSTM